MVICFPLFCVGLRTRCRADLLSGCSKATCFRNIHYCKLDKDESPVLKYAIWWMHTIQYIHSEHRRPLVGIQPPTPALLIPCSNSRATTKRQTAKTQNKSFRKHYLWDFTRATRLVHSPSKTTHDAALVYRTPILLLRNIVLYHSSFKHPSFLNCFNIIRSSRVTG